MTTGWGSEEFGADSPRHGWTWDHSRRDAIALLGSEDAVRKYVKGGQERKEPDEADNGQSDQSGAAGASHQRALFYDRAGAFSHHASVPGEQAV